MKTISIIQPSFFAWRGYFSLIAASDVFVFYDDVQFDKGGWRNRNRIKTPKGLKWVTVPVLTKGHFGQKIKDTKIAYDYDWAHKVLRTLELNYKKAPHFDRYFPWLEDVLSRKWETIGDLSVELTKGFCERLHLGAKLLKASELGVDCDLDRIARLIEICKHLQGTRYLSGQGAKNYIQDSGQFARHGIQLEYLEYRLEPYPQLHSDFLAEVSVVDLLFNCGDDARKYL